jgi:hypothetical protein
MCDASRRGEDRDILPALEVLRSCDRAGSPCMPAGAPRLVLVAAIALAVRGPGDEDPAYSRAAAAAAS